MEAEKVAKHFEAILPIWILDNCTLLDKFGIITSNVSCDEFHNFACQITLRDFDLDKPIWLEAVPGKEYALAYVRGTSSQTMKANFFDARYICNHIFKGSKVVEPMNQREQNALVSLTSRQTGSLWLGFHDLRNLMHWVRDSDGGEMTYANFRPIGTVVLSEEPF